MEPHQRILRGTLIAVSVPAACGCSLIYSVDHLSDGPVNGVSDGSVDSTSEGSVDGFSDGGSSPDAPFDPIRIACGDMAPVTDAQGNVWNADQDFLGGAVHADAGQPVQGTDTPVLYDDQRYGPGSSAFSYTFAVPPGGYSVLLKFTENNVTSPGQRVFDVAINGAMVLTNFDIYGVAGGQWIALDLTFPVTVGDSGAIEIAFSPHGTSNDPKIDAIAITQGST